MTTTSPAPTLDETRKKIIRLLREDFDPTPAGWEGRDWNDNAEDVADKIIALQSRLAPSAPAEEEPELITWLQEAASDDELYGPYERRQLRNAASALATAEQAMREKDYNKAAEELLASRWAHQTPKRAHVLAKRMEMDTLQ